MSSNDVFNKVLGVPFHIRELIETNRRLTEEELATQRRRADKAAEKDRQRAAVTTLVQFQGLSAAKDSAARKPESKKFPATPEDVMFLALVAVSLVLNAVMIGWLDIRLLSWPTWLRIVAFLCTWVLWGCVIAWAVVGLPRLLPIAGVFALRGLRRAGAAFVLLLRRLPAMFRRKSVQASPYSIRIPLRGISPPTDKR